MYLALKSHMREKQARRESRFYLNPSILTGFLCLIRNR